MSNNKVSEKAVWEGTITPDKDVQQAVPHIHTQPQMMFCYKCNNVSPGDSKFCPYCNIELYATCPKCGVKYSSQYPSCSQCGTNRDEYLLAQRREQERKEAIERENRRRQEILERKNRERKAAIERENRRRQEIVERERRKAKECYDLENVRIVQTQEYKLTYSVLKEALESTRWKHTLCAFDTNMREQFIRKYILKKGYEYDQYMLDHVLNRINWSFYQFTYDVLNNLSELCIIAYREKNGMPIL